jgi:phosphatidylinositol alpha-mannosyltransferase
VHVHSPLNPSLPLLAIDAAECAVVGTFHTWFEKSHLFALARAPLQRRLDRMSAAIAVSHSTTLALSRYFEADWKIIPNGVDLDAFRPGAPPPPGIRPDVPAFLFVGRLDPRNGLKTLIDAFRKISTSGRRAQLVIVGDGPLRNYYRGLARGHPDITFAGALLDGRASYYAHASAYACPTTKASFGITLLESMACATPVVCSDIAGFRDVVSHDREALMFPCGNVDALAESLVRILEDRELALRLGESGRQTATKYAWPSVTQRILDVYREVLGFRAAA